MPKARKGLLAYPLRRVIGQHRTTGTLMDPSHTILKLECGHVAHVPNRGGYFHHRQAARCDECPRLDAPAAASQTPPGP